MSARYPDVLDAAVTRLAHDDYNHVPEVELRRRLGLIRGTRFETRLEEVVDRLIEDLREVLEQPDDPRYGP